MAKRIANSVLNASTIDILNVIRQNASYEYQQSVPEVKVATDIPRVGEVLYGTPAFANQFINALVNRIAIVRMQSATFNNPYSDLKKGYLEYGETVEDIFVSIANAVEFSAEKAAKREYQRTIPDVRSAFHTMNWRVMYPVTIQDEDLKQAFLSMDGVQNLIGKIVDSVYTAAEYDEFLLFKYLLIKAISHGRMTPATIGDGTNLNDAATQFRGNSNLLPFISTNFNEANVKTNTPKDRQAIFMDALFNAKFDVNVLASAFNMDKADFMGRLYLIDNWASFDNERFEVIRANSDGIEAVTEEELAVMDRVKAVLIDTNWFQVYDNNNKFTEKYVSSGLYWNYFYHTWKTISSSPFANAVVFVEGDLGTLLPAEINVKIDSKDKSEDATTLTLSPVFTTVGIAPQNVEFVQTETLTSLGVAVQKYGAVTIPKTQETTDLTLVVSLMGTLYTANTNINAESAVGSVTKLVKGVTMRSKARTVK